MGYIKEYKDNLFSVRISCDKCGVNLTDCAHVRIIGKQMVHDTELERKTTCLCHYCATNLGLTDYYINKEEDC